MTGLGLPGLPCNNFTQDSAETKDCVQKLWDRRAVSHGSRRANKGATGAKIRIPGMELWYVSKVHDVSILVYTYRHRLHAATPIADASDTVQSLAS